MSIASSEQPVATDFSKLIECSEFGHLTLFNKNPLSVGSRVLHIPTDNYKYDVYFHILDESTIKVSLWRYYSGDFYSEQKDSYTISIDDYIANISLVDAALLAAKTYNHYGCVWLEQPVAQDLFKKFKAFAQTDTPAKQHDLFNA